MILMSHKLTPYILLAGLFTLMLFFIFTARTPNLQTCTYEDEERKITTKIPQNWTCKIMERTAATEDMEGSPNYGIEIYIDGNEQNSIYLFYQLGTVSFTQPGMLIDIFKTNEGKTGDLYTFFHDNTTTVFGVFDIGHYGFTTRLDNNLFNQNKKEIFSVIENIHITEY